VQKCGQQFSVVHTVAKRSARFVHAEAANRRIEQAQRKSGKNKMPSYVYVLMHRNGKRFKIGKAVDIDARAYQLGKGRFDLVGSFGLRFATEARSLEAEGALHRLFSNFRCASQDVVAEDGTESGATEFFRIDCYDHVVDFVERNLVLLHAEPVYDLTYVFDPDRDAGNTLRREEALRRRHDRAARQREQQERRDATRQREIRRNEAQIDGPIRAAIGAIARLCTISVLGNAWLFVARLEDKDAVRQSIDVLYDVTFSVSEIGGVALWGTHSYHDDVEQGKVVHCMRAHHFAERTDVLGNWTRRVIDILNDVRESLTCSDVLEYHNECWASYVEQELAEIDQRIAVEEKEVCGASDGRERAEWLKLLEANRTWRRRFVDLKPDFGLRNETRVETNETL
jgi:hypothetical protein